MATPEDVISEAKKYFFPGGRSARGIEAERCTFELGDFSHNRIAKHETVADVHQRVMPLGILRFHVYTTEPSVQTLGSETSSPADKRVPTDDSRQDTMVTNKQGQSISLSDKIQSSSLAANQPANQPTLPLEPEENTHEALDSFVVQDATYCILDVTDSDTARFVLQTDVEQDCDLSDTLHFDIQGLSDIEKERVVKVPPVEEIATPPPRSPTRPPEQVDLAVQREYADQKCIFTGQVFLKI